jgi:hypothetical protein
MRNPSAIEDAAFLQAEAREIAVLAEECVAPCADARRPASVLHTLAVELSVLRGLGDSGRMDWLVAEASRLLADEGKHAAHSALKRAVSALP